MFFSLTRRARQFSARLRTLKQSSTPPDSRWYGYDSIGNVWLIEQLLQQRFAALLKRCTGLIADIGAADGDLGFFLEAQGREVHFLDWPATNWNGMRGIRHLHGLLASKAQIHAVDLDSQFTLPQSDYGLVCLLGILYHLKNPLFVLETLARSSRQLLLSTRIAAVAPDGTVLRDLPVAYLLDPQECNDDATNYWIFSAAGLRRLLARSGWEIEAWMTVGCQQESDPVRGDRDERAFLLARSRHC